MKLTPYEIQVIELMLKNKLSSVYWTEFLESYEVVEFDYTGAGYFLKVRIDNLSFEQETIHEPVLMGQAANFDVGFLLFLDGNQITMECHSWGEMKPPENVRNQEIIIKTKNGLPTKPKLH